MKNTLVSQQQSLARLCKVYCTIGWVDFALFFNFMKRHVVCGSPRYVQYGELPNCLDFGSKTSESNPCKGPYFQKNPSFKKIKNVNIFFEKMYSLISTLYLKNQILNKKSV